MSKRRNLQARVAMLGDLRDVLESMKNLAMVEMGKLARTEPERRRLLDELLLVARATARYHPMTARQPAVRLYALVGSERGFCGDFNDGVVRAWLDASAQEPRSRAIVVGGVLAERLRGMPGIAATLAAPAIVEDIDRSLVALLECLSGLEKSGEPPALAAIANGVDGVARTAILPFDPPKSGASDWPPELNLEPQVFSREFVDHCVDAALHSVFATSLLLENRARLAHMTLAIDRLDENVGALRRDIHRLRQEEVTEEVETILLSSEAVPWDA